MAVESYFQNIITNLIINIYNIHAMHTGKTLAYSTNSGGSIGTPGVY